ncbi:MAG: ATP-binding protein [Pseudomonadota bacterium]
MQDNSTMQSADTSSLRSTNTPWLDKSIVRLAAAIAAVQIVFWFLVFPTLISPPGKPFEQVELASFELGQVQHSDTKSLRVPELKPYSPEQTLIRPGYYLGRATFELEQVPERGLALIVQGGGDNERNFINGHALPFDGSMDMEQPDYYAAIPQIIQVPPIYLKSGLNTVSTLFVFGEPTREAYFSAPLIGEYDQIVSALSWRLFLRTDAHLFAIVMGFVLSMSLAVVCIRSRDKTLPFWLLLLTLSWSVHSLFFRWAEMPFHGEARLVFYSVTLLLLAACWPIFVDAWTQRSNALFRNCALALFLASTAAVIIRLFAYDGEMAWTDVETILDRVGLVFTGATLARLSWHFIKVPDEKRFWEAAILVLLASLLAVYLFNTMIYGQNVPYLRLGQPMILLAFAVMFFSRNFQLFRSTEQINAELASQLDQKTLALENAHQREKVLVRQQAHDEERRRLMRDMHDGLGSQLMSMLIMARKGHNTAKTYEDGIQQVIEEMRLMLNSLEAVGDSLESALHTFERMIGPRVTNAGFSFEWKDRLRADQYPDYDARQILQVFRILQEGVTNALKHSQGDAITIVLSPGSWPDWKMAIEIIDNGIGFPAVQTSARGRGLRNIETRAASIRAEVEISAADAEQKGARLILCLREAGNNIRA